MSASNAQRERQRQQREREESSRFSMSPGKMVAGTKDTIVEHAVPSVALCFGIGFGAGLLIGIALAESMREDRTTAQRYSQQFMDAWYRMMPQSLGGRG
jgi:hypothetical protein